MTGSPSPITWKDLERQVRRRCRDGGLRGRVKVTPWTPQHERSAAARDHAYVYPDDLDFHFSSKILALPQAHRDAIVDHEVGHCLAQHHWNSSTEDEADAAAQQWLGTKICYDPRWHGKGLQVVCSRAANPSNYVAPSRDTPSELGYLYHATNTENLYDITESGKLVTHGPSYGTDQSEWPDGSRQKRSYWSPHASHVWYFAPEEGRAVILRTRRTDDFKDERGTGDVYTTKPVLVSRLEVLTTDGWRPLGEQRNPSRVRRGTPPPMISGYLMKSEIDARYRGVYFVGDTQIASSRTTPSPSSIPVGTWRYDDQVKGLYGHEIDELVEIDPRDLDPVEFSWERVRDDLKHSGKLADAERYAQWLAEGNEMPPVTVVQTDNDMLKLSDGHRRTYAAVLAGKPVRAWVSWNAPHPEDLVDAYGRPMKVGLTYEIATGRMAAREKNPRQTRISRRITS